MRSATRKECLHNIIYSGEDPEPTKIEFSTNLYAHCTEVLLKFSDFVHSLSIRCLGPKHGEITIHT